MAKKKPKILKFNLTDAVTLPSNIRKQVNGFLVCEKLIIAKEIVMTYQSWEFEDSVLKELGYPEVVRVLRTKDVLEADMSLYDGLPLTDGHYWEPITVKDTTRVAGILQNAKSTKKGIAGGLVITCPNCIFDIESEDKRELSLGYGAEFSVESGVHDGIEYDLKITKIIPNHVALVKAGRCGPECSIQDGAACACTDCSNKNSSTLKEGNIDMSDATKKLIAVAVLGSVVNVQDAAEKTVLDDLVQKLADANAEVDKLKGEATIKDGELKTLTEKFSDENVAALVINGAKNRAGIIAKANGHLADGAVTDAMSNREIKVAVLTANKIEVLDEATDEFVDGAFGAIPVKPATTSGTTTASAVASNLTAQPTNVADGTSGGVDPVVAARQKLLDRNARKTDA